MKDFYATIKIQHGPIREAMLELGIKSASELARRAGKHSTSIGRLLNFKDSPRCADGELTPTAKAVCEALHAEPAYLFPKHLDVELPCNTISAFAERAHHLLRLSVVAARKGAFAPEHQSVCIAVMSWQDPFFDSWHRWVKADKRREEK